MATYYHNCFWEKIKQIYIIYFLITEKTAFDVSESGFFVGTRGKWDTKKKQSKNNKIFFVLTCLNKFKQRWTKNWGLIVVSQ